MLQNFDMNLFVVLHALMEERSVTKTGERLGKTQSAISNALKRLRLNFHDPLFVRTPGGLVPTPRAEEICNLTAEIVLLTQKCLAPRSDFDPVTASARIAVGAPDRLSLPVFLPFLEALAQSAPGISIDLRTTDREYAIKLIEGSEIDLALGWFDQLPPQINARKAFDEPLVCLCRVGHPLLETGDQMDLDALLSFPHLVVSSAGDRRAAFDAILARFGRKRRALTSLGNFTLVPELLKRGDLVGVFTKQTARYFAEHYGLACRPLPLDIEPIRLQIIWHRRFDRDKMHTWLRDGLYRQCLLTNGES